MSVGEENLPGRSTATSIPRRVASRAQFFAARRDGRQRWSVLVPTLVLAIVMSWWVAHDTRDRLAYLAVDSATYVSTANSIRHFHAPTVAFTSVWDNYTPEQAATRNGKIPSTVFPPGYPATLALTSFVVGTVHGAARVLDVLLIGINLVLVGLLVARMTAFRSVVAASIPPLLLVFVSDIPRLTIDHWGWLVVHLMVASDPLFIALFLTGLLLIDRSLRVATWTALVLAASVTAAAILVRYVGIALVLTAIIALVGFDRARTGRARLERASLFGAIAVGPMFAFLAWGALQGANASQGIAVHLHGNVSRYWTSLASICSRARGRTACVRPAYC